MKSPVEVHKQEILNSQGKKVRHFKGNEYLILGFFEHTEKPGEIMVGYKALYGEYKNYVRPLDMFVSEVDEERQKEYNQKFRFEVI
ncbi:hypothetical protein BFS06_14380 [Clostridium perfringens]|nr:DUF1653 domain-containing protein [Clostridium perfringens]TBX14393.1 hypothetical protein BFS06_14380 [Clostridium perfringens]